MQYIQSLQNYTRPEPTAVTVGKFDGVHAGHRLLMDRLLAKKNAGLPVVAVTFDVPPIVRTEHREIRLLVTPEEKREMLRNTGVDVMVELPFSEEVRTMPPETFIKLLTERLHMQYMAVGSDFRFGYKGAGNISMLRDLAVMLHFDLDVVEKKRQNRRDISSTLIRDEIAAGHIKSANALLGYPYYLIGEIVHGNHIGTSISFPTINLLPPPEKLLPPNGVYITEVVIEGRTYKGITNVGIRPTVQEENKRVGVETHILDFRGDIYEKRATVRFLDFVRLEKAFSSFDELKRQISDDVRRARAYFNSQNA